MKKRIVLLVIGVIVIFIFLGLILYINFSKINKVNQKRYDEIKEIIQNGVEKNIRAMYPNCLIDRNLQKDNLQGTHYDSSFLINNGYIKKEDLLDVDQKSFCKAKVNIYVYYENPLDHQKDCQVNYKISLECKHYKDEFNDIK